MDRSAEEFRQVHLQPTQREKARRAERIGLDQKIDIAIGAESVGEDGAKQKQAHDTDAAARGANAREIESNVVQTEHGFHCIAPSRRLQAATVAAATSDHGPFSPRVLTHRRA